MMIMILITIQVMMTDDYNNGYDDDRKQILAYAIFQTLVQVISNGCVKTPLHVVTGQSIYSRCRSKTIIKSLNRVVHQLVAVKFEKIVHC